jgi:hypothetical protein
VLVQAREHLAAAAPAYEWRHVVEPLARWLAAPRRQMTRVALRDGAGGVSARQMRRNALERMAEDVRLLIPTPVRQYVLGPAKRRMQTVLRAARAR